MPTAARRSSAFRRSEHLRPKDRLILQRVEPALSRGKQLLAWHRRKQRDNGFDQKFELTRTFNRPDESYGFFDRARVDGQLMPVMGNTQGMFYDQPKMPPDDLQTAARWMCRQVGEFVLHYFLRVSDFQLPREVLPDDREQVPLPLRPFSMCPSDRAQRVGFGFSQLYFKRKDTGQVGRFAEEDRQAIVNLREVGRRYEWIVLRVQVFDFKFTFDLLGPSAPQLVLPLNEESLLVVSRDFITDRKGGGDRTAGHYGLGYAFIEDPEPGLLGYGPGRFKAAFQTIRFRVLPDGRVRVRMTFVANRPDSVINLPLDPIDWGVGMADMMSFGMASRFLDPFREALSGRPRLESGFDPVLTYVRLANLMTGGEAARQLCISKRQLEIDFLVQHFRQHYQTIANSLMTWRQIRNWLDRESLPNWVITGKSA